MSGSDPTSSAVCMRTRRGPVSSMNAVSSSAVRPPEVIPLASSCCRKGLRPAVEISPLWKPTPIQKETPTIVALR